ncbi:hypothetical protein PSE10C_07820 [Pseudomonas amygdali pv. eriobotryae]|uniref:Uncharacterized protein n=1 Tax=Pseudomonas amygdali pv. eriobotryae TaxID=129137 RepID=A0A9P3AAA4_PSEA0|nr:hypothetical protein PSE10A_09080 [Pseudomonas amygdali pv. eriobotryae]GFZ70040.1 hypothetical protein PSE10C_07820 [Pseudomonas amygdali pv. eriobotryae]
MDPEGVLLAFKVLRARNMNFWLFRPLGEEEGGKGMRVLADLFADKSAPTGVYKSAFGLLASLRTSPLLQVQRQAW